MSIPGADTAEGGIAIRSVSGLSKALCAEALKAQFLQIKMSNQIRNERTIRLLQARRYASSAYRILVLCKSNQLGQGVF